MRFLFFGLDLLSTDSGDESLVSRVRICLDGVLDRAESLAIAPQKKESIGYRNDGRPIDTKQRGLSLGAKS